MIDRHIERHRIREEGNPLNTMRDKEEIEVNKD